MVKFLARIGFEDLVERTVPHPRGDHATYQLADVMLLTLVAIVDGASSMAKVCAVWPDGVLANIIIHFGIRNIDGRPNR